MYNKLEELIKSFKGNVLVIGLDDKLLNAFDKNNKINLYSIESNKKVNNLIKSKKRKTNKGKTINIKRLRKYINKKSVNYMICNIDEMKDYYKYFIKDSIYLNNNILYIYSNNGIDKNFIINKYQRYDTDISYIEYKNGYIITINNTRSKNKYFNDKIYFIKDTFYNIAEAIGNILVS